MSTALTEQEIARFLASTAPEVLCLRGAWGVGKTFSWNAFLRNAQGRIALPSYSYVSLFGLDALSELKFAIFENSVAVADISVEPSVETFKSNTVAVAKRLGMRSLSIVQMLPLARSYANAFQSLSFLSVRETIVCIDDLERKGKHLAMRDVLGLTAHLRDQKKCKVVLILNDDALDGPDKDDFTRYNEKVIDVSLEFAPDARDCARIAITAGDELSEQLRAAVIALNLSNIRIVKKIERLVTRAAALLKPFHPQVLRQAVQTLALLVWSAHGKDAPTIQFIREIRNAHPFGPRENEQVVDEQKKWHALLDAYGFSVLDDFDVELLSSVERGYFDDAKLTQLATALDAQFRAVQAEGSLRDAWRPYHNSFDDDEPDVVRQIVEGFRRNVRFVTPTTLNSIVGLLKDLGHAEQAAEVLRYYMEQRREGRTFFDEREYAFWGEVTDPDVRSAFAEKYQSFEDQRRPTDVLLKIGGQRGWSRDDISLLSKLTVDDYYRLFKQEKGGNLSRIVHAALQFDRIAGIDEDERNIAVRAKEALLRIGRTTRLNRLRVKKFGVEVGN